VVSGTNFANGGVSPDQRAEVDALLTEFSISGLSTKNRWNGYGRRRCRGWISERRIHLRLTVINKSFIRAPLRQIETGQWNTTVTTPSLSTFEKSNPFSFSIAYCTSVCPYVSTYIYHIFPKLRIIDPFSFLERNNAAIVKHIKKRARG
jgi:hypothetical protein